MAEDVIKKFFDKKERNSEGMRSFGYRLKNVFSSFEAYRRPQELIWLECLRQYKGLYDPNVVLEENASKVYPKITRSKVNIVQSRLMKMLFPDSGKNFEISPTPEPSIRKDQVMEIAKGLVQQGEPDPQTGEIPPPKMPTPEEVMVAIKKWALDRCKAMESVIDDQLTEMVYKELIKKVLKSGLMYGVGIAKGPLIQQRKTRRWEPDESGEYAESIGNEEVPFFEPVRVWDWYPDPSVSELDQMEGTFERHVMTKHDLRQLMKRDDFIPEMIKEYLENNPDGDYVAKNWEVDLQVIEVEAGTGASGKSISSSVSNDGFSRSTNRQIGRKYQVLEYWGYVDGSDLAACGVTVDDVEIEYAANVWLLGNRPIKAVLYDEALNEYKVFYYEKDETSIWGEGLARVMRHSQIAVAAAARMVLDNGAICCGPQLEVNWSLVTPDTNVTSMYPRKIWFREGKGIDAQYPAIRAINADSHIAELLSIVDAFKNFGDEETTLPTWLIGQSAGNETAQGFSGRMSQVLVAIEDVVKNFDMFTERVIKDLYEWNMEFNPREDIKGDYNVKPLGSSSLVQKEVRMQAMTALRSMLQPEDWIYIPRRDFLKSLMEDHEIRIQLRTEEEAQNYAASQRDDKAIELAYASQEAEIGLHKAQTMSQLTKAKKANVEAISQANTAPEQGTDPRINDEELASKETDRAGKEEEIRRQNERHDLEMRHTQEQHDADLAQKNLQAAQSDETHGVDLATKVATTKAQLENQKEMQSHTMGLQKEQAKNAAASQKQAAKEKKSEVKGKKLKTRK